MKTWYFVEHSMESLKQIEEQTTVKQTTGELPTAPDPLVDNGIIELSHMCYDPSDQAITMWIDRGYELQEEIDGNFDGDIEAKVLTIDEFIEQLHKGGF